MSASEKLKNDRINSPVIEVVALALRNSTEDKYLVARRGPGGSGVGYWEFPGGKIELGETQEVALRREILEELSFDLAGHQLSYLGKNYHAYEFRNILIYLWRAEVNYRPEFKLIDHDQIDWLSKSEIRETNLSEADRFFLTLI